MIDKIIIGRINDDGSIDPYEVRFILKTGDELTDTLPIKKIPSSQIKKVDDTNNTNDELCTEMCAYAHNGEHSSCISKRTNCFN